MAGSGGLGPPSKAGMQTFAVTIGWVVFAVVVAVAAVLDACYFFRKGVIVIDDDLDCDGDARERPAQAEAASSKTARNAVRQILYWLIVSAIFNFVVLGLLGHEAAGGWLYGYIVEYLLSVDNLFVFRMVFQAYKTPSNQLDRALRWGVSAAVVLRIAFFAVGTELLALGIVARILFGGALIYSGVKTVRDSGDDDDNPSDNCCVRLVTRMLPLHSEYAENADFFIRVEPLQQSAEAQVVGTPVELSFMEDHIDSASRDTFHLDADNPNESPERDTVAQMSSTAPVAGGGKTNQTSETGSLKVTLLFLVVVTLGIIDVIFAVDSVTAKISSFPDGSPAKNFFINLTSSAFAMFVLRSIYFLLDLMADMFHFLNYGVGIVLILIGVKLIFSGFFDPGMLISCAVIVFILLTSVVASWLYPPQDGGEAGEPVDQGDEILGEDI